MNQEIAQVISGAARWGAETNAQPIGMRPDAKVALYTRVASLSAQVEAEARAAFAGLADRAMRPMLVGDVAVIDVAGPITYKLTWFSMMFGCASIEAMQQQFRAALADPAVRVIVFRCDSPGGNVTFVPEFANEIFAARGVKPIYAVADTQICSAAYWLMSQCDQIFVSLSSMLGYIGTYLDHEDISVMMDRIGVKVTRIASPAEKAEGNEFEPLSEAAHTHLQEFADELTAEFKAGVVRGRGVPLATVTEWSKIGVVPPRGKKAVSIRMADKMGTFAQVMAKLTKGRSSASDGAHASACDDLQDLEGTTVEAVASAGSGSEPEKESAAAPLPVEPAPPQVPSAAATANQAQADADLAATSMALVG